MNAIRFSWKVPGRRIVVSNAPDCCCGLALHLTAKRAPGAGSIFQLNADEHTDSGNAHVSLGVTRLKGASKENVEWAKRAMK